MAHTYQEFDWYEVPVYYDIIFDTGTRLECDFLESIYERHVAGGKRRILEPACGSGRLVAEMARRGYRVTGFDISDGALAYAKKHIAGTVSPTGKRASAAPARVVKASMESFRFRQRFDLAHCLVSSFKYLLAEDDARAHLECVAEALRPGGVYVLGFHLSEYDDRSISRERWVASRNGVKVVCTVQSWPPERRKRRERMRSRLVVEKAGRVTRYQTLWEFRTYSARQFRTLLAKVPALLHVATYDFDYDLTRPRQLGKERLDQVVILQKRQS